MVEVVEPGSAFGALATFRSAARLVLDLWEVAHSRIVELAEPPQPDPAAVRGVHLVQAEPVLLGRPVGLHRDADEPETDAALPEAAQSRPLLDEWPRHYGGGSTSVARVNACHPG